MRSPHTTTAPTGTSPASSARWAERRASSIQSSSELIRLCIGRRRSAISEGITGGTYCDGQIRSDGLKVRVSSAEQASTERNSHVEQRRIKDMRIQSRHGSSAGFGDIRKARIFAFTELRGNSVTSSTLRMPSDCLDRFLTDLSRLASLATGTACVCLGASWGCRVCSARFFSSIFCRG